MLVSDPTKVAVDPQALAVASGVTRQPWSYRVQVYRPGLSTRPYGGMAGLGLNLPDFQTVGDAFGTYTQDTSSSILNAAQMGLNFIPGIGTAASSAMQIFRQAIAALDKMFRPGASEADAIVPTQNQIADRLGQITDQILVSKNPDVDTLRQLYLEVWQLGLGFMEFVLLPKFTDRRASGQALNTIMPYIDGTCDYQVPLGTTATIGSRGCLTWGDGTVGGAGNDGMMGALARAIVAKGGQVPTLQEITAAAAQHVQPGSVTVPHVTTVGQLVSSTNVSTMALGLGALALYFFSKRR